LIDLYPRLSDASSKTQSGKSDYFIQDMWALQKVFGTKPPVHYDIGSRIDGFVGQCSIFTKVTYIDIRKPNLKIPNVEFLEANILKLPLPDASINSVSCLHVIEHIGLGRYGDALNPLGSIQALNELKRILAPHGDLYLGMPIGTARVLFNAHRILDPQVVHTQLQPLTLIEFSVITPNNTLKENMPVDSWKKSQDAFGLFHFKNVPHASI
jgi:SAM-dependent methyltransferase